MLRPWQAGDKIQPFGMAGHKKVSDILIDKKVTQFDKRRVHVLTSDDKIIWIVGICLSERARVSEDDASVVRAEWIEDILSA